MKKFLLLLTVILFSSYLTYGQVPNGRPSARPAAKPPLALREVSGIVKDTSDNTVIGATVKLKTATDSVSTTTNADGIFVFKNVTSATFVLTITSIGYRPLIRKMLNNDVVPRLVLDPIVLNAQSNQLKDVIINGAPSITFKTDTVEYRASDYKVRPNSTVDELLKKMEGMEVGSDGSVTHQGQAVTKARLNGKDYAGGDLAKAIQNLPADIVEKIQVVDDYGDQAARTGIKDGDPQKILNITTRADRSVGNILRASAGAGNDERYESRLFLQRLNGNEQISVIGRFNNTVNGVASSGIAGGSSGGDATANGRTGNSNNSNSGSGGTTNSGGPALSYRSQWGKKIQVNGSYRYSYRNVNSLNNSYGEQYRNVIPGSGTQSRNTTFFNYNSERQNNNKTHDFDFELEYSIDSANFLRITPSINYSGSESQTQLTRIQNGFIHRDTRGLTYSNNTVPKFGGIIFYQHLFDKPRRNFSIQLNYNKSNEEQDNEQNNQIRYYFDVSNTFRDSLVHRNVLRSNSNNSLRVSMTYVEPLTPISQLEFNAQMNRRSYDNNALTSNISPTGVNVLIDSLSNIYNYSFTESRFALNYRLNQTKYNISVGVTAVPTVLEGNKVSLGNVSTRRTNLNIIPIARFQYVWSRQQRISLNYAGNPTEPTFNQIQPVRDETNPQNAIVGNPDLKPSFRHSVNFKYDNYIVNSKLNLSTNINTSFIGNQIVTNVVQIPDIITTGGDTTYKNETRYMNLNGTYVINGNYNISKQLADRKYNLSYLGNVTYGHVYSMSNNIRNLTTSWRFNQRFGPRINPNESIEVNPFVAYNVARAHYNVKDTTTNVRTLSMNLEGKFYLLSNKSLTFGYDVSKSMVRGIENNLTRNPLVINAYIEKEFFARRALTLNLQVFDILKQNNFVNQETTEHGYTNTLTNALSRYFMFSVKAYLQKWSGSPKKHGKELRRRGDGSFIQN